MVPDERSGPVYPDFPVFHLLLPKNLHISNIFYIFAPANKPKTHQKFISLPIRPRLCYFVTTPKPHNINRLHPMSQHLKTRVIRRLKSVGCTFESLPADSTPHKRGVYYFRFCTGVECYWGTMDYGKEGRQYRKRIIVRPSCFRDGLFELYTYHLPKHWSAACVANRELIKEAQRQAHALEHDHSFVGIEWRVRFFLHYYRVFKGGAKPDPGMKPYSRFYQYTYVALYRQLKAAAQEPAASLSARFLSGAPCVSAESQLPAFDPVPLPSRYRHNPSATRFRRSATLSFASAFDADIGSAVLYNPSATRFRRSATLSFASAFDADIGSAVLCKHSRRITAPG